MKYKRLTRRNKDGTTWVKCAVCDIQDKCDYTKETCCQELQDRLAELEDKIEQGTLKEIPENAVVLTDENEIKQYKWSKMLDKMGFFKFADNLRNETVDKFAERLKEKFAYDIERCKAVDEIAKEIMEV